MIDYTKLLEKISPKPDGEDKLRLRTGTVTTANADGTLDITMSDGVLLPGVNKLATAHAPAGAVVQIIVFRGAMLVIGAVASSTSSGEWTGLTFETGFTNNGSGYVAGYKRVGGTVHLRGVIQRSSGVFTFNTSFIPFVLPVGLRPSLRPHLWWGVTQWSSSNMPLARCEVQSDGDLVVAATADATSGTAPTWIDINTQYEVM